MEGTNKNEFVINIRFSKGLNEQGATEKLKEFLKILAKHNPVNLGTRVSGQMYINSHDQITRDLSARDQSNTCVLFDKDDLIGLIKEVKQKDLGLSVVIAGHYETIKKYCFEAGVSPHTVVFSLGIWGDVEKLPSPLVKEVTTMCGHGMIPGKLVETLANRVEDGVITPWEAAVEISKRCVCGIVNVPRVTKIIQKIIKDGQGLS